MTSFNSVRSLLATALTTMVLASSLPGHEIKALASNLLVSEVGGKTTVYLSWGHRLPVDDLIEPGTLARYDLVGPDGKSQVLKTVEKSLQVNVVELKQAGIHQVAVARKHSLFSEVIDEEGSRQLKRGGKSAQNGGRVESATRSLQCAKALIVVGKSGEQAPRPTGLPIEIVPLDAPTKWTSSATLRFQVLLEGKPLSSAEVVARPVGFKPDNAWNYATQSDRQGEFTIKPTQAGTWVVKVATKRLAPVKVREEYDFESFTATLSLEVAP